MIKNRPDRKRKLNSYLLGFIALLLISIVAADVIHWRYRETPELHRIRTQGNILARNLQRYVKKTGRFPAKLEDLYATADADFPGALMGLCFQVYTPPAVKAPPATTVIVIRCGEQQALVRKDFHVIVWQ